MNRSPSFEGGGAKTIVNCASGYGRPPGTTRVDFPKSTISGPARLVSHVGIGLGAGGSFFGLKTMDELAGLSDHEQLDADDVVVIEPAAITGIFGRGLGRFWFLEGGRP